MVNADRSIDCVEMGALATQKSASNGTQDLSLCHVPSEDGSRVYKLTIQIEKIRPKPCPKSKKFNFNKETIKREETKPDATTKSLEEKPTSRKKETVCLICNEMFQSAQSLYLHKKKHHRFVCQICDAYCSTRVICERHEKLHLSNDPNLPHKCHLCPQKFDTKRNVRLHTRVMHSFVPPVGGKITQVKDSLSRLKSSYLRQIVQPPEKIIDADFKEKTSVKRYDGKNTKNCGAITFTCRVCCQDFSTVEAAEAHTREHLELVEKEHRCNICKKVFKNDTVLNVHLSQHLSRALRCPMCPKAFINRATLRIHMKSHGQEK